MRSQSEYAAKENIVAVYLCSSRFRCVLQCGSSQRDDTLRKPSHGDRGFGLLRALSWQRMATTLITTPRLNYQLSSRERTPLRGIAFQAACVSKSLLSVEKMNENGHAVVFARDMSFVVKKTTGEVNRLGRQDGCCVHDFRILLVDVAEKWRFWQAAVVPRNSRIKGIIPPKTFFLGSSIEVAHGQRERGRGRKKTQGHRKGNSALWVAKH